MEEIVTTDAIRREILEDARKKAEHLLREADDEIARARKEGGEAAAAAVAEIERSSAQRIARLRSEMLARVPLEKTRTKTAAIDRRVREAFERFMASLPEDRVLALAGGLLAAGGPYFERAELRIRYKGVSADGARSLVARRFPGARLADPAADPALPAAGLVVETADGKVAARATMDLVEEDLLGRRRGEFARALCGEALTL